MTDHVCGRDHLAGDDVVGQVEQAGEEGAVALDRLALERVALGRRLLDHEAALRADRDDQRVLDHLRLHQPQHLGAEVLRAVRPAQAAAGHPSAAQVHGLHLRRVDEHLELRPRLRQQLDRVGVELERQARTRVRRPIGAVVVGSQDRHHDGVERAEDPVLVEALDRLDRMGEALGDPLDPSRVPLLRIEPGGEQVDEPAGDVGVADQRALHVGVRVLDAGLTQVTGDGAHDGHLAAAQSGAEDERTEPVVLELPAADAEEGFVEQLAPLAGVGRQVAQPEVVHPHRGARAHPKFVRPHRRASAQPDLVRPFVDHRGPEPLESRQHVRERHRPGAEQPAAGRPVLARRLVEHDQLATGLERLELLDVVERPLRRALVPVGGREPVVPRELGRALWAVRIGQRLAQGVVPTRAPPPRSPPRAQRCRCRWGHRSGSGR